MFDKLTLLSPVITRKFAVIARDEGVPTGGYESCIDLRKTKYKLPARLYYRGRYNGIHKLDIIGVARLGLPYTQQLVERIFPNLRKVKIYRVDLCVDLLGLDPWFFVTRARVSRQQNYALFRSRGAVSFYLQFSKQRRLVFYDRLKLLRRQKSPLAALYASRDQLTRVEVQFTGAAVPYKRFVEIHQYAEITPLKHVRFTKVRVKASGHSPVKFLAAHGLRQLIAEHGLQATSKMFSSPVWAALEKRYVVPIQGSEMPRIGMLMRRGIKRWLEGKILFPRVGGKRGSGKKVLGNRRYGNSLEPRRSKRLRRPLFGTNRDVPRRGLRDDR